MPTRDLFLAAAEGNLAEVQRLLAAGAEVDEEGSDGRTAMHAAVLAGHVEIVSVLLGAGADPNAANETGHTPLFTAASFDRAEIACDLIAAGATMGMLEAAALGDTAALQRLLDSGAAVEDSGTLGSTPLIEAAGNGRRDAVEFLLDHGADPNAQTSYGWTALMKALFRGHGEVARLLMERGADVTIRSQDGSTAVHRLVMTYWSRRNRPEGVDIVVYQRQVDEEIEALVRARVARGADINARNDRGYSAVSWAEQVQQHKLLPVLRELGAVRKPPRRIRLEIAEDELLEFLAAIGTGQVALVPQAVYSGVVRYYASNGWRIGVLIDRNDWNCVEWIAAPIGRQVEFDDIEGNPQLRWYRPSEEIAWSRYGIPGRMCMRCTSCGMALQHGRKHRFRCDECGDPEA